MTDTDELRIDRQDGCAYTLEAFIDEYGGSVEDPPSEWLAAPAAAALARSRSRRRGDDASETATLTELWKQRSWTEVKSILCRRYELEVQEDEDLCIVSAPHDSSLWARSDHYRQVLRESRGSVYEKCSGKLLCLPFFKFWNHSERNADDIDWKTAIAEEKIDGNLMKLFHYKGCGVWQATGLLMFTIQEANVHALVDPITNYLLKQRGTVTLSTTVWMKDAVICLNACILISESFWTIRKPCFIILERATWRRCKSWMWILEFNDQDDGRFAVEQSVKQSWTPSIALPRALW